MSLTNLGVVCYLFGGHEGLVLAQHVPVSLLQHALVVGAGLLHGWAGRVIAVGVGGATGAGTAGLGGPVGGGAAGGATPPMP